MFLDSTLRKLQIVLTAARTTLDMPVLVDYVDITTTTTTPGLYPINTNGVTTVDFLPAPAASTQRKVNGITIYNKDTAAKIVQIFLNDNGTQYQIQDVTLQIDDMLGYTDTGGWYVQDTNGNRKVTTGTGGGSGTVTSVSVVTANNLQGSVATPTTTPAITLSTVGTPSASTDVATKGYVDSTATATATGTFRNAFINGDDSVNQVNNPTNGTTGTAVTVTAAAAVASVIDRWYASCTGQNITAQQVAGTGQFKYAMKLIAGATGPTTTLFGTRLEGNDCYKYINQPMNIKVDIFGDVARTVTWTAYYANALDNFSTKTQIATGSISSTASNATYNVQFNAGTNAGNGICVEFITGALTNITGFQTYQGRQLEQVPSGATTGTAFESLPYDTQLSRCQRFLPAFHAENGVFMTMGISTTISTGSPPARTSRVQPTGVSSIGTWYTNTSTLQDVATVSFSTYGGGFYLSFSIGLAHLVANTAIMVSGSSGARLFLTGCELW